MSLRRRQFMSRSFGAAALAGVSPVADMGRALARPVRHGEGRHIVLLYTPETASFAEAAAAALGARGATPTARLRLGRSLVLDPHALGQALSAHAGSRFLGLMDGCAQILLEESLRDLSGTVLCHGWHAGPLRGIGPSRHSFVTGPESAGIGAAMGHALKGGAAFAVREQCAGIPPAPVSQPSRLRRDTWPALLAAALAMIATGSWTGGGVVAESLGGEAADLPRHAGWASILADG